MCGGLSIAIQVHLQQWPGEQKKKPVHFQTFFATLIDPQLWLDQLWLGLWCRGAPRTMLEEEWPFSAEPSATNVASKNHIMSRTKITVSGRFWKMLLVVRWHDIATTNLTFNLPSHVGSFRMICSDENYFWNGPFSGDIRSFSGATNYSLLLASWRVIIHLGPAGLGFESFWPMNIWCGLEAFGDNGAKCIWYCWWFRNPAKTQLVDSLSHYVRGFRQTRWLFGTSSINCISLYLTITILPNPTSKIMPLQMVKYCEFFPSV